MPAAETRYDVVINSDARRTNKTVQGQILYTVTGWIFYSLSELFTKYIVTCVVCFTLWKSDLSVWLVTYNFKRPYLLFTNYIYVLRDLSLFYCLKIIGYPYQLLPVSYKLDYSGPLL